jgi:opacity protein-like surface antigen
MKIKLAAIVLSGMFLTSSVSFAEGSNPKFYLGAEAQANSHKNVKEIRTSAGNVLRSAENKKSLFNKSSAGASALVGTRLHENIGVEVGMTGLSGNKLSIANSTNHSLKARSRNLHTDVLGYLPMSDEMDLIGSVGVGKLTTKVSGQLGNTALSASDNVSMKSSKAGLRLGAGAQYKISDNMSARFMVRHQQGNSFVKSVNSAGLGLFYQF